VRRRPPVALAALALTIVVLGATACGGDETAQPRLTTLRDALGTTPTACGLGRQPIELGELPSLPTVDAQVAAVVAALGRLRGLEAKRPLEPTFLSESEFDERLTRTVTRELGEQDAALASRALVLLGAAPPGFQLRDRLVAALAANTGGFYDPDAKRLFVPRAGKGTLGPVELEALAHELEHALTDQVLGLPEELEGDGWGDTALGAQALVEGSATVTELRFLLALVDPITRVLLFATPFEAAFETLRLPHYLNRQLAFPYVEGLGFVCHLYARGGWKAVEAAYERPPGSSAEILFPERYLRGERPAAPPALGRPGPGWKKASDLSGSFGAADLLALFQAPGDEVARALDRPLERAAAWGGGHLDAWVRGNETALGIALVERGSRGRLCESIATWYDRAFPDADRSGGSLDTLFEDRRQSAVVRCRGSSVLVGIGPDAETARRLARD
jgi:hypothetical protein